MIKISSYVKIKYLFIFMCVNVAAFVLSSFLLSVLDSRLATDSPHRPVRIPDAEKYFVSKLPVDHYRNIWEKNIFFTSGDEQNKTSELIQVDQLSLTSLNCTLAGTIVHEGSDGWAVILDNEGGRQEMVTVGSNVKGARVVRIFRDKVVLNINGKDELLVMDMEERPETTVAASAPVSSSRGSILTYNVSRNIVQQSLNDLGSFMSNVRIEPHFRGGQSDGFRLSQIQSGSLLSSVGFQNGDIIKSINGRDITTAEDAMRIYSAMKENSFFRVGIIRGNQPKTIQIRVR